MGYTPRRHEPKLRIDRGKLTAEPKSILEPIGEKDVHLPRTKGHHRDWIDCIRSRQDPIAHVDAGARTATLCHLLNLAYWNRRKLRWDAANWKFIGDSEANTWLDRPAATHGNCRSCEEERGFLTGKWQSH